MKWSWSRWRETQWKPKFITKKPNSIATAFRWIFKPEHNSKTKIMKAQKLNQETSISQIVLTQRNETNSLTWKPTGSGSCCTVNLISSAGLNNSVTDSWCVADVTSDPFTFKIRSPILNLPHLAAIPSGTIWKKNKKKEIENGEKNSEFSDLRKVSFIDQLTERHTCEMKMPGLFAPNGTHEWSVPPMMLKPNEPWFFGRTTSCETKQIHFICQTEKEENIKLKIRLKWNSLPLIFRCKSLKCKCYLFEANEKWIKRKTMCHEKATVCKLQRWTFHAPKII